jgi:glutamine amidotransferase
MYSRLGVKALVSAEPQVISQATHLILPGVGAFDRGMQNLKELNLIPVLEDSVLKRKVPVLGICLGLQLMGLRSEEGRESGLGWFDAECIRFRLAGRTDLKVPLMGWRTIISKRKDALLSQLGPDSRFYFVHSYHLSGLPEESLVASAEHGYEFPAIVRQGNIMGAQFHPEKSHTFGMRLLKNFYENTGMDQGYGPTGDKKSGASTL